MSARHAIHLDGSRFWIVHRRRTYGPFDYEWSADFCGLEMFYAGSKFGEYCSCDEIHADLQHYRLPMSVVAVSSIVMGCIVYGVLNGLNAQERVGMVADRLQQHGYDRFSLQS